MTASFEEAEWWMDRIFTLLILLLCTIVIIHTRHVYLDLSSIDKKKWDSPALEKAHKLISFCTLASLYCYAWNQIFSELSISPLVYKLCPIIAHNGAWSYLLAKMFMYLVFVQRLFIVFGASAYRYRQMTLLIVSAFIIVASLIINVLVSLRMKPHAGYHEHEYMRYCSADIDAAIAALIGLYDFGLAIYSSVAFILPLRKLIKHSMDGHGDVKRNESSEKRLVALFNTAAKTAILATTASLTTVSLMVLIGVGIGSSFGVIDFLTNAVCMILMTHHYDKKHYRRLCCGPIWCSKCCMQCCCGFTEHSLRIMPSSTPSPSTKVSIQLQENNMVCVEVTGSANI